MFISKQYTFCKMGSTWSKVYDLPSKKSWDASVEAAGSWNSLDTPESTRAQRAKSIKKITPNKDQRTHQTRAKRKARNLDKGRSWTTQDEAWMKEVARARESELRGEQKGGQKELTSTLFVAERGTQATEWSGEIRGSVAKFRGGNAI